MKTMLYALMMGLATPVYAGSGVKEVASPSGLSEAVAHAFADMNQPGHPGCSVGIQQNGQVIFTGGYGYADIENQVLITPNTYFNIASMSKQFTVLAIMSLVNEGKMALDDDVRKYIPELAETDTTIQVSHLIHHTSGISDYLYYYGFAGMRNFSKLSLQDAMDVITLPGMPIEPAGTVWAYSNSGYVLLAEIVARVSGQSFEAYAQEEVLNKVGMQRSFFRSLDQPDYGPVAKGYHMSGEQGFAEDSATVAYGGDGGLVTTMNEFMKYAHDMSKRELLWHEKNTNFILKPGPLADEDGDLYAGGIGIRTFAGRTAYRHSGGISGYNSLFTHLPDEDLTIAAFCNIRGAGLNDRFLKIASFFLGDFERPEREHEQAAVPENMVLISDEMKTALTGTYYSETLKSEYTINPSGTGLSLEIMSPYIDEPEKDVFPQVPIINGAFIPLGDSGALIHLPPVEDGQVMSFTITHPRAPDYTFKRKK